MRTSRMLLSGFALLICLLPLSAAEVDLIDTESFDFGLVVPIIAASVGTVILWRWILPVSLGNLQVAFEVDDDLYEVHRLTRSQTQTKELLTLRGVPLGVLSYLMAMGGIMLIVAELLIGPGTYSKPNVLSLIHICR